MPQKSNDRDNRAASPAPLEPEDDLEMTEDDDEFEEDEEVDDETGVEEGEDPEE
jgi:hypothetical protein